MLRFEILLKDLLRSEPPVEEKEEKEKEKEKEKEEVGSERKADPPPRAEEKKLILRNTSPL